MKDIVLSLLAVYSVIMISVGLLYPTNIELNKIFTFSDNIICVIFLSSFAYELYKSENKIYYIKHNWLDLITSIPAIGILRYGKIFKVIKIFRIVRSLKKIKALSYSVSDNPCIYLSIFSLSIILFSSVAILLVEKDPACNIKTAEDAIWWVMETITTVGYGDKFPITTFGRIIGMALMIVGIGIYGSCSGLIANFIIKHEK